MRQQQKLIVDFNTKIIPASVQIWVSFPGKNYRFFTHQIREGMLYADFPALLIKSFNFEEDEPLRPMLAISEKINSFHSQRLDPNKYPSKRIQDYGGYGWTGKRINSKGVVRGLYARAKKGDLVITTSPNGVWGTTHIGEFIDDPKDVLYTELPWYLGEKTPARRIRWLNTIQNIEFSQEIIKQLTSPNAFSLLGRSKYDQIFSAAYENFVRINALDQTEPTIVNSFFDIRAEEFSTVADMYLKLVANFGSDLAECVDNNDIARLTQMDFLSWILNLEEGYYTPSQKININSPGRNILQSGSLSPIFAAVVFTICQFSATELANAELTFVNSANGNGILEACDIPVAEGSKTAFETMSLANLEILCTASKKAKELGSIETPITVTKP